MKDCPSRQSSIKSSIRRERQARHEIDDLFWKDFCDYYIEIAKERLYQPEKHGAEQRYSGQIALYHSLLGISQKDEKRNDTGRAGRETLCEQADYLQMGAGRSISGNE